jgi:hypothetical protein
MSHSWNCPTELEARRQGERAQQYGDGSWRNPYRDSWGGNHCEEAERAWERGHRDEQLRQEERAYEERAQQRRLEARQEQARVEEAYWQQQYECQAQEEQQAAYEAEYYAAMEAEQVFEETQFARLADDGAPSPDARPPLARDHGVAGIPPLAQTPRHHARDDDSLPGIAAIRGLEGAHGEGAG